MKELALLALVGIVALLIGAACNPDLNAELREKVERQGGEVVGTY